MSNTGLATEIFKAYDIRGIVGQSLTTDTAKQIGRALGSEALSRKQSAIVVGRDGRLSGPDLVKALSEGIASTGCNVIDVGMVPTPALYFATYHLKTNSGVMVTGSHNPPDYNGFKMVRRMPYLLSGDAGLQDLRALVEEGRFDPPPRQGRVVHRDLSAGFVDKVLSFVDPGQLKPLKVVADTANGMVGPILQRVYERLPVQLVGLYLDPDGRAPNHGMDPMQPENRADLEQRVRDEGLGDDELERAKEQVKAGLAMAMESTSFRATRAAMSEVYWGRHVPAAEVLAKVDAVTRQETEQVTSEILDPDALAYAAVGPFDEEGAQ